MAAVIDEGRPEPRVVRVTARELAVWRALAGGAGAESVAAALGCTARTVGNHRHRLHQKLGVRCGIELAVLGLRLGVVTLRDVWSPAVRLRLPDGEDV